MKHVHYKNVELLIKAMIHFYKKSKKVLQINDMTQKKVALSNNMITREKEVPLTIFWTLQQAV
jgi:hypothetical protein